MPEISLSESINIFLRNFEFNGKCSVAHRGASSFILVVLDVKVQAQFLGTFAKLRKVTISFVMYVFRTQLGFHSKDFDKILCFIFVP
jgi:hypothetical protein